MILWFLVEYSVTANVEGWISNGLDGVWTSRKFLPEFVTEFLGMYVCSLIWLGILWDSDADLASGGVGDFCLVLSEWTGVQNSVLAFNEVVGFHRGMGLHMMIRRQWMVRIMMDKHRQAEWRTMFPGVQDAGLASSRGMGQYWLARRGGIVEVLLGKAGRWGGSLPAFQDPCLASNEVDDFLQMCRHG